MHFYDNLKKKFGSYDNILDGLKENISATK